MSDANGAMHGLLPDDLGPLGARGGVPPLRSDTEAVAARFDEFCAAARDRITGVGAEQYATADGQRYERIPVEQIVTELQAELLDVAAYSFMTFDRLDRIREGLLRVAYS